MKFATGERRPPGRRRSLIAWLVGVLVLGGSIATLGRLGQLEPALRRLEHANPALIGLAVAFEALSFAGYVVLTRSVFRPAAPRISWRESVQITLAGVVATRLVTVGGLGGIALTVWALRAAGMDARGAARRLGAFLVTLYAVFFAALAIAGAGLATGVLAGGAPRGLALAGAGAGALVLALGLGSLALPGAPGQTVRLALTIVRSRPSALVAATAWWAFDVAVLWAAFEMFGSPPAVGVLVLCYFLGQLAQVIPLPGGVGPVEGGMIAALAACGTPLALAVLAVLVHRAISAWLPAALGLWAYLSLRRTVAAWRAGVTEPVSRPRSWRRRLTDGSSGAGTLAPS